MDTGTKTLQVSQLSFNVCPKCIITPFNLITINYFNLKQLFFKISFEDRERTLIFLNIFCRFFQGG